ncbi:MAG: hypothetical protein KAT05_05075 [Spirochaetes bacterium]|nr:hypothetical protein [Spirochaetota bacterium]
MSVDIVTDLTWVLQLFSFSLFFALFFQTILYPEKVEKYNNVLGWGIMMSFIVFVLTWESLDSLTNRVLIGCIIMAITVFILVKTIKKISKDEKMKI